jgi:hypothetical protein
VCRQTQLCFICRILGTTAIGSAQLHVSANNIRHHQIVHRHFRIAISRMCSAIWRVWGGVCMGRDLACICRGCIVWGYYGTGVVIGSNALLLIMPMSKLAHHISSRNM